jgi:hypothetical protein
MTSVCVAGIDETLRVVPRNVRATKVGRTFNGFFAGPATANDSFKYRGQQWRAFSPKSGQGETMASSRSRITSRHHRDLCLE